MSVPSYQEFMLPVLNFLSDGVKRSRKELFEQLAKESALTAEQRSEMLPSGKTQTYKSRIGWALIYLKQAGVIERVKRGVYRINERGADLLRDQPSHIDSKLLTKYPEFRDFKQRSRQSQAVKKSTVTANDPSSEFDRFEAVSPEEQIEEGFNQLRTELVSELLDTLMSVDPARFEQIVVDVLVAMGYGGGREGAARAVGQSSDGGIDGLIDEDRLGLDTIYVQAKRWEGTVGRPIVQSFAGALQGRNANKGVMISTSDYSKGAFDYANNLSTKIVLINGSRLAELMIDHNVGVSEESSYVIKRLDSDYFED